MSKVSIILGEMGTGKSYSLRTLDIESTYIIEAIPTKELPFRGSDEYIKRKHLTYAGEHTECINALRVISEKCPQIKTIVVDDAIYAMRNENFRRASQKSFEKYSEMAQHIQQLIVTCGQLREDIRVFLVLHSEPVTDADKNIVGYKAATVGKMLDNQYNPLECVAVVLYSDIEFDEAGNAKYGFRTRKRRVGQVVLPCKSPDGMFEEDFINNDLNAVVEAMNKYYAGA